MNEISAGGGGRLPLRSSALRLWIRLARAYRAIEQAAARDVARHGLTLAEFGMLEAIHHLGPMPLGEIQRKILVSSGGVTYVADSLEKRSLIRREPSVSDRRVRIAVLTEQGEKLIREIFPEHERVLEETMSGLDPGEQEEAASLLRRLGIRAAQIEEE
ncbi:MAG: MarR family transcriptional regulator [marine benthic group bacterium]|jgi:MarR family 2-MHQ and catechol resistance regulon transcriptional repressor|nr:MarR family transcriptional regulator [Gemmatimonadota bacterium]